MGWGSDALFDAAKPAVATCFLVRPLNTFVVVVAIDILNLLGVFLNGLDLV
jgi:hypothetical protein